MLTSVRLGIDSTIITITSIHAEIQVGRNKIVEMVKYVGEQPSPQQEKIKNQTKITKPIFSTK
jgi:hypothetical protein